MSKRDRKQIRSRVAVFVRQYARKAHANFDPNDRRYDREIESLIKRMNPEKLDRMMREDEEEWAE